MGLQVYDGPHEPGTKGRGNHLLIEVGQIWMETRLLGERGLGGSIYTGPLNEREQRKRGFLC